MFVFVCGGRKEFFGWGVRGEVSTATSVSSCTLTRLSLELTVEQAGLGDPDAELVLGGCHGGPVPLERETIDNNVNAPPLKIGHPLSDSLT